MAKQTKDEGSPVVTGANGKTRKVRAGDEIREQCEKCSDLAGHPVLMRETNKKTGRFYDQPTNRAFRYYKCPLCLLTRKVVNHDVLRVRRRRLEQEAEQPNLNSRA